MNHFTKILFLSFTFFAKIYSNCVPQNIDTNIPYQQQNISAEYNPSNVVQSNGLLHLILTQSGGTSIKLDNKIQYGKVDVTMKVAYGNSIVSSFILYSDETKDEVDFEFVERYAYPNRNIQTTFYYRGIPLYNVNDLYIDTGIELAYSFNKYTFIWDANFYEWRFNDKFIRRTYRNETDNYPDSLSYIKISIWEHQPSKWSGPAPNWNDVPFILYISSINVSCTENNHTQPTTQFFTRTTSGKPTSSLLTTTTKINEKVEISNSSSFFKVNSFILILYLIIILV